MRFLSRVGGARAAPDRRKSVASAAMRSRLLWTEYCGVVAAAALVVVLRAVKRAAYRSNQPRARRRPSDCPDRTRR